VILAMHSIVNQIYGGSFLFVLLSSVCINDSYYCLRLID
jgi:predicted DNA-binding helix-hairpin-helix protein